VSRARVMFVVNHVAFFASHRLPIALAAREAGHEVLLVTGQPASLSMEAAAVRQADTAGIAHRRVAFRSSSVNPFTELRGLWGLFNLMRRWRPNIVHCVSPKGVMYGGLAARIANVPAVVVAISGMGYASTSSGRTDLRRWGVRTVIQLMSRIVYAHRKLVVIVQNTDDEANVRSALRRSGSRIELIRGSGVNPEHYAHVSSRKKESVVLFPARMLLDKGLIEFVSAARRLKRDHPRWRFVLAGAADYENPTSVSVTQIAQWEHEGIIEWLGHVDDMKPLYWDAAIVCLPSYREGMPKCLIEAAAAACAVVTTDVVGCREAIVRGKTGDLVPARDVGALTEALDQLLRDDERRIRYGEAGQALARREFSLDAVVSQTLDIYDSLASTPAEVPRVSRFRPTFPQNE
jgi:glycosyltransferase involved in cell wall biosynthesis